MDTGSEPTESIPTPDPGHAALHITEGVLLDGRYRLLKLLGRGGTAEVYQGSDELLDRPIAVKVFDIRLTDLNTVARQRREMQLLAALNHPHLIAVYDARIADDLASADSPAPAGHTGSGHTYLVMELVQGRTLAQQLVTGPMSPSAVTPLGHTLASALATVHAADLVHRDVKPANVLMADTGEVKLGDFGLARILSAESRLTTSAAVMGTAAYFSPEQARSGDVGPPSDIYALGLVLLECLTGQREFPGEAIPAAVARLLRDPVIPVGLPQPWAPLLTAMTAMDPAVRPTATQVTDTLASSPGPASISPPASAVPSTRTAALPRAELDTTALPLSAMDTVAFAEPSTWRSSPRPFRSHRHRRLLRAGIGTLLALAAGTAIIATHSGAKNLDQTPAPLTSPQRSAPISRVPTPMPSNAVATGGAIPTQGPTPGKATTTHAVPSPSNTLRTSVVPATPTINTATTPSLIQANDGKGKGKGKGNSNGDGGGNSDR